MTISLVAKRVWSWIAAGAWGVFLGVCSLLRGSAAGAALDWSSARLQSLYAAVVGTPSHDTAVLLRDVTPWLLQVFGYMILALLLWNALRLHIGRRSSLLLALAVTCLLAVLHELNQMFIPGRVPQVADWAIDMLGAACLLAGIWIFQWLWSRFPRFVNRETVSYVVFGVLTTIVNIVTFQVCYHAFPFSDVLNNTLSNTLAWVLSVLFAYVVNKLFVFQSKTAGARALLWEAGKFIGARVFSYAVDMAGMLLLVNALRVNSGLSKIGMNVIVMIMNYFFSKWFIFKEKTDTPPADEPKES